MRMIGLAAGGGLLAACSPSAPATPSAAATPASAPKPTAAPAAPVQAVPTTAPAVAAAPTKFTDPPVLADRLRPDKANQLLDDAGLKKGADGFRLMSNGQPLELTVETIETSGANFDAIDLVRKNWESVGVKTVVKLSERVGILDARYRQPGPDRPVGHGPRPGAVRRSDLPVPVRRALMDGTGVRHLVQHRWPER